MTKSLTEQWREGTLPDGNYYFKIKDGTILSGCQAITDGVFRCEYADFYKRVKEVLAPVPSYRELYGANDGNMPTGVFTILKIIKRDIENAQKRRSLTDLECGIKSQVVSLLKMWGVE